MDENLPRTLEEAITRFLGGLSSEEREQLRATPEQDLIRYHFGWAAGLRSRFGLWGRNPELLESTGQMHPDSASMEIIRKAWESLQPKH